MPSYAEYRKRIEKGRRDFEAREVDRTYNEVDRALRQQPTWHGKKAVRAGTELEGEDYGSWEEVSPGRFRWKAK